MSQAWEGHASLPLTVHYREHDNRLHPTGKETGKRSLDTEAKRRGEVWVGC